ncbi:L,D-transpeptidase [Phytohabitans kaempferiae]|uniref:Ig-like domain-containing protein n=1 Tax=Phytohabitans kaempferiae TaxID=1620943 RepID=A0ABV6MFZ1_9ACTN
MSRGTRGLVKAAVLAVLAPLALAACGEGDDSPRFVTGTTPGPVASAEATPSASAAPAAFAFSVTPAANAKNLPVSSEIGVKLDGGEVTSVTLTESGGGTVSGSMREDGTAWVPSGPLKYGKTYTASVTATKDGGTATETTTFTTMGQPGKRVGTGLYLFDDKTYGVAMPVVVEFHPGIAKKDRASVQKRMFVSTDPPQPGAWHWVSNGTQAYYRAPEYWQSGTKITVRIGLGGHPMGQGRYGDTDRKATAKIGERFEMKVDNRTKQMTVLKNGKVVKTMPVSLGKKATPSASGTMVVMEKKEQTVFDTTDDPNPANRYRVDIAFAQRLTWSGQYIHAAPWSVQHQGQRNVSHGCVNVSTENARWLFGQTKIGDPVTVTGTEEKLGAGNGWTAWNMSWKEFIKGSALPVTL